jgi:replicative DNA helicase
MKHNVPQDDNGPTPEEMAAAFEAEDMAKQTTRDNGQQVPDDDDEDAEQKASQFPLEAFPPLFQETVQRVMERCCVEAVLPAMVLLGINSSSFGAGLQLIFYGSVIRGNLFQLIGAKSGTGKSRVIKALQFPLIEAQALHAERFREQYRKDAVEQKIVTGKIQRALKDSAKGTLSDAKAQSELEALSLKEDELEDKLKHEPRLLMEDFTSEAMGILLQNSKEQMAVLSAEGGLVLANILGRYLKGDLTDDILLSKCYTGDSHMVDRVGRPSVILASPCLTLTLCTQPDLLYKAYSHDRLWCGGFLARCLSVDTRLKRQAPDLNLDTSTDIHLVLAKWTQHISSLIEAFRFASTPCTVLLGPRVEELAHAALLENIQLTNGELADVDVFAVRWCEQTWRIALNLHVGLYGVECFKNQHPLTVETFHNATLIMDYYAKEQLRILNRFRTTADEKDLVRIKELLLLNKGEPISFRKLETNHGFSVVSLKKLARNYPKLLTIQEAVSGKGSRGGRPRLFMCNAEEGEKGKFPGFGA